MEKTVKSSDLKIRKSINKKVIIVIFIMLILVVMIGSNNRTSYLHEAFNYDERLVANHVPNYIYYSKYKYKDIKFKLSFDNFEKIKELTEKNKKYNEYVENNNSKYKSEEYMMPKNKAKYYWGAVLELLLYGDCYRYYVSFRGHIWDTTNPEESPVVQSAGCAASATSSSAQAVSPASKQNSFSNFNVPYYESNNSLLVIGKTDSRPENGFYNAALNPLSTFSADVDTASYSILRRCINDDSDRKNLRSISDIVRLEEMINYFDYDYPEPDKDNPFGMRAEISKCPWNEENDLLMVGLRTKEITYNKKAPSNYVFLIDVSGSMYSADKIGLLLDSMEKMISRLKRNDTISIVVYAGQEQVLLEGFKGKDKNKISKHIEALNAQGSTNGEAGIKKAYEIAEKYYIEGGNNRIILATDGDFNVGISSDRELVDLISRKRETGVGLSVLGFGIGNLNDSMMEKLADNGNGVYFYIDSEKEADKVLCEELSANTIIVAKDVKFQIEFNPKYVSEYRLIGYEDRVMADEDFNNDSRDAGDMGSGRSVTMMYEIKRNEGDSINDNLKYQDYVLSEEAYEDEWMTLSCRYKALDGADSYLTKWAIGEDDYTKHPGTDFKFAALVAEYGMTLRKSDYIEYTDESYSKIVNKLNKLHLTDKYKKEFVSIVKDTDKQIKKGIIVE